MTEEEDDVAARFACVEKSKVDAYWAAREEAERVAAERQARREHFLHQPGLALIWLATISIAFDDGHMWNRAPSQSTATVWLYCEVVVLFAGALLHGMNRHRRDRDDR